MKLNKIYSTIDIHVAGEAFRIIHDLSLPRTNSLYQLSEQFPIKFEKEISLLLKEPRGYAGLSGCAVLPPYHQQADAAALFFNHEGEMTVSYSGIVAVITCLLETGKLEVRSSQQYTIETIAGIIQVTAILEEDEVIEVWMAMDDVHVIPNQQADYSIAEGNSYRLALFDSNITIELEKLPQLSNWGKSKATLLDDRVDGIVLIDSKSSHIKTMTFNKDGQILRSPGFETTAACFANFKKESASEQLFINESIFGSRLQMHHSDKGSRLKSRGFITSMQTFVLDPTDPLAKGFLIK